MITERAKVNHLVERGAKLIVDSDKVNDFEALGHRVAGEAQAALERATVVIDCTPAGNENKKQYEKIKGPLGLPGPGQRVRLRQDVRDGHQRRSPRPGPGPLPPDRLLQHPQHRLPHHDPGHRRRRSPHPDQGPLRVHAPGQRRLAGLGLRSGALGRQARRPGVRDAPRARRGGASLDAGVAAPDFLLRDEAQHPVHALALVRHGAVGAGHPRARRSPSSARTGGSR